MQKCLSGNDEYQEIQGSSYFMGQHGYNTTAKEGACTVDDGKSVLAVEGRFDNRDEIIRRLHCADNSGYGAICAEGYHQQGVDFFRSTCGPFAVAIFDSRRRMLRLIRDPMGLRSLLYTRHNDQIVFGSDVRQMLASGKTPAAISERKILELFSPMHCLEESGMRDNQTMFEGIQTVPYGSLVEFTSGRSDSVHRYWDPPSRLRHDWSSSKDCAMEFRALFLRVMSEHMDMPYNLAAELSGGIDSGCTVSIAANMLATRQKAINAYTAVFGTQSVEERTRAHAIPERYPNVRGKMINCDEHVGFLEGTDLDAYRTTAFPSRQNLPATFVTLAQLAAKEDARTLLSGEGADWFLEGSDMIWDSLLKRGNIQELYRTFAVLKQRSGCRKALRYILNSTSPSLLLGKAGRLAYLNAHYESLMEEEIPDLFTPAFTLKLRETMRNQREELMQERNLSCWSQTLEHELMFPPNHVWQGVPIDVEMRLPYLDRRIVEFGLSVPPEYKFRIDDTNVSHYGCRKYLQREAFRDTVPAEVIGAQEKEIYWSPVNRRLVRELPLLLSSTCILCEMGVLERDKLVRASQEFLDDQNNDSHPLIPWLDNIVVTEKWLRATTTEFPDCRLPTFHSVSFDKGESDHLSP